MEKTNLHWKSEHPSIFISLCLLVGICIGNTLPVSQQYILFIISFSWVLLVIIHQSSFSLVTKSLYSKIGLLLWGYCIAHLQLNMGNTFIEITENQFDDKLGYYGKVGDRTVIKNCKIIKDVWIGEDAYLKGANKIKNVTINSHPEATTQIGEGCELVNGIIGYGCRIFYGIKFSNINRFKICYYIM